MSESESIESHSEKSSLKWKHDIQSLKALVQNTKSLVLERSRAISTQLPTRNLDTTIDKNLTLIHGLIAQQEHLLSIAENDLTSPIGKGKKNEGDSNNKSNPSMHITSTTDLKEWEDSLLGVSKEYDRLYENWNSWNSITTNAIPQTLPQSRNQSTTGTKHRNERQILFDSFQDNNNNAYNYDDTTNLIPSAQDIPSEYHLDQQQLIETQDEQLDALTEALDRQQRIGNMINDELDAQIEVLDDTDRRLNGTQIGMRSANRYMDEVADQTIDDSNATILIIILILVLIVIVLLAKHF